MPYPEVAEAHSYGLLYEMEGKQEIRAFWWSISATVLTLGFPVLRVVFGHFALLQNLPALHCHGWSIRTLPAQAAGRAPGDG